MRIVETGRLNRRQFDRFSDFIYRKSGIRISSNKVSLLSNRIRRRVRAGDFEDFDAYYRFVSSPSGAVELESFLDAITTNETFFFRTTNLSPAVKGLVSRRRWRTLPFGQPLYLVR